MSVYSLKHPGFKIVHLSISSHYLSITQPHLWRQNHSSWLAAIIDFVFWTILLLQSSLWSLSFIGKYHFWDISFLAPTGALGVTISVRSSVRPVQLCLEQSIFIFLTKILKLLTLAVSQQSFKCHSVSHHTVGALNTSSCFHLFYFFRIILSLINVSK